MSQRNPLDQNLKWSVRIKHTSPGVENSGAEVRGELDKDGKRLDHYVITHAANSHGVRQNGPDCVLDGDDGTFDCGPLLTRHRLLSYKPAQAWS